MHPIYAQLPEILRSVRRPGDFYHAGRREMFMPSVEIDGVGPLAFPVLPQQAKQLQEVAEPAPYGQGAHTLVDTAVRRTWQIAAERVRLGGKYWPRDLDAIVQRCAQGLGVADPVVAQLYKLLIYDEGSFFLSHRDTEKAPGMFATLSMVLPSAHSGGELLVRHAGREVCLDLSTAEPPDITYAAFYADCQHELRPLRSGWRIALVFNLLRVGAGRLPQAPSHAEQEDALAALLQDWAAQPPAAEQPCKIVYPLEHAYSHAELSFATLKNADAAAAKVLTAAAARANCELHLGSIAITENGMAEQTHFSRHDRDDEYEIVEVYERQASIGAWCCPDGLATQLPELEFKDGELAPPDALRGIESDEISFEEATGNEAPSFERIYRVAALVLWPRPQRLAVIGAGGWRSLLTYLGALLEAGQNARGEALDVLNTLAARWPHQSCYGFNAHAVSRFLDAAVQLGGEHAIASYLIGLANRPRYDAGENPALVRALGILRADFAARSVGEIVRAHAATALPACADLFARAAPALAAEARPLLHSAGARLVEVLQHRPAPPRDRYTVRPAGEDAAILADLLLGLDAANAAAEADKLLEHLIASPKTFDPGQILVPAALRLGQLQRGTLPASWARLFQACVLWLDERIACPVAAPKNYTRPAKLACNCADCAQLSAFLRDPARREWRFQAAQARRSHVETTIGNGRCDVDTRTETHTRPHVLLCVKNQGSYLRAVELRKQELEQRDALRAALAG
ncbi:MAG: 2OG-Fe(II) oxygenase [Rhodocyclaceae bacterium]|nr:2OG-Fe(II) oxygenase [Rhodocyclaceae bacterium]MBX3668996.1 2OG-Fe(II) oxygenase [Rhodocyclaceae bacterium]